jgi:polyisoprenoid-binding protein YceI
MVNKKDLHLAEQIMNTMKRTYLMSAAIALVALGMTACGGSAEEGGDETGPVTYVLDTDATTLKWKGDYADDSHSHNGTIAITEGTVVYNGDAFESGEFTVDMNTIADEDLPSPDKDTLNSHLSGPYFFQASQYPTTKVTVKEVTDNEIKATLNVLGKDMDVTIPVKVKRTDKKITAKGKFTIDFTDAKMMGTSPMDPTKPTQHVKPVINFDINLVMKAEAAEAAE